MGGKERREDGEWKVWGVGEGGGVGGRGGVMRFHNRTLTKLDQWTQKGQSVFLFVCFFTPMHVAVHMMQPKMPPDRLPRRQFGRLPDSSLGGARQQLL